MPVSTAEPERARRRSAAHRRVEVQAVGVSNPRLVERDDRQVDRREVDLGLRDPPPPAPLEERRLRVEVHLEPRAPPRTVEAEMAPQVDLHQRPGSADVPSPPLAPPAT